MIFFRDKVFVVKKFESSASFNSFNRRWSRRIAFSKIDRVRTSVLAWRDISKFEVEQHFYRKSIFSAHAVYRLWFRERSIRIQNHLRIEAILCVQDLHRKKLYHRDERLIASVIVLKYTNDFSMQKQQRRTNRIFALKEQSLTWCDRLVENVQNWNSNLLIDFFSHEMLRMKALKRLFVDVCLTKEFELRFFNESFTSWKRTTLTRTRISIDGTQKKKEIFIIIEDILWNAKTAFWNYDNKNDYAKRFVFECHFVTSTFRKAQSSKNRSILIFFILN